MTKNDTFFKILFAIELALLPLVAYAFYFIKSAWVTTLLVVAVFFCMVWTEIFKDKTSIKGQLINSVGAIVAFGFITIFFCVASNLPVALTVVSLVLAVLAHAIKFALYGKTMPEIIEAIDWCLVIFQCLAVLLIAFLSKAAFLANIGLVAVIITSAASLLYKVYFAFRYTYLWSNIKKLFRRK